MRGKRPSQARSTSSIFSQRKGIVADYIPWLVIGIAVLVILTLTIFLLKGQGANLIDKIKNLFSGA